MNYENPIITILISIIVGLLIVIIGMSAYYPVGVAIGDSMEPSMGDRCLTNYNYIDENTDIGKGDIVGYKANLNYNNTDKLKFYKNVSVNNNKYSIIGNNERKNKYLVHTSIRNSFNSTNSRYKPIDINHYQDKRILHRIIKEIDIKNNTYYIIKGDGNEKVDPIVLKKSELSYTLEDYYCISVNK